MVVSEFSQTLERDGVTAFFNSLRLLPVFVDSDEARKLFSSIENQVPLSETERKIKDALLNAKYFVENEAVDQQVLAKVRAQTGKPKVKIAYFIVTEKCNFDCTYCFIKREMPTDYSPVSMSATTALKALDTLEKILVCEGENDENSIIIYGGEPLLKIDVIGLIAQSVSERKKRNTLPGGLHVSLVTNGSLLNKENAVFLKDNNIAVSISLDGDEVATNSCRRYSNGRSVYDDIRRAIKCCREVELDFSLSVTITESLLSNPASSLDTLIRDIGVQSLGFNILMHDEETASDYPDRAAIVS